MRIITKHKLILSFLLIILMFLSFGVFTIKGIFTLGHLTRTIYNHPLVVSNAALNAALDISKIQREMTYLVSLSRSEDISSIVNHISEHELKVSHQLDIIRDTILGDQGKTLEAQTRKLFMDWKPIIEDVAIEIKSKNRSEALRLIQSKGAVERAEELENKMLELTSYARGKANSFINQAEENLVDFEKIAKVLTLIGVLTSIVIALFTTSRVLLSEKRLKEEKKNLEDAIAEIKILRGIIPICSHCKKIRNDEGIWNKIEEYIHEHSEASFSHGICPDCVAEHYAGYEPRAGARQKK